MLRFPSYQEEHKILESLERRVESSSKQRSFAPHSLRWLLKAYLRDNARAAAFLVNRLIAWRSSPYSEIASLRNSQCNRSALVVGNGPSQALLVPEDLAEFKRQGGHIFAVNNYFNSEVLVEVGPTAVVWSDGATIPYIVGDEAALSRFKGSLQSNEQMFCFVPEGLRSSLGQLDVRFPIVSFCDIEIRRRGLRESNSTRPDLPRSYVSMTLLKALAIAQWMGYREILLIGMDNTYPRDIYCSPNNEVLVRERHAHESDYVLNCSQEFRSVGDFLFEVSLLMLDLAKFADDRVVNLDPYSLTDAFRKAKGGSQVRRLLRGEHIK